MRIPSDIRINGKESEYRNVGCLYVGILGAPPKHGYPDVSANVFVGFNVGIHAELYGSRSLMLCE